MATHTTQKTSWEQPVGTDDPSDPVHFAMRPITKADRERDQLVSAILGAVLLVLGLWAFGAFDQDVDRPRSTGATSWVRPA